MNTSENARRCARTVRNPVATQGVQLAYLTTRALLARVLEHSGRHAGFDETRAYRVDAYVSLLKLVDGRLGHVVHAARSVSPEPARTYGVHTYADLLALSVETRQCTTAWSPVE